MLMNNLRMAVHKKTRLFVKEKMYSKHPNKMNWFEKQEEGRNPRDGWINHTRYKSIRKSKQQIRLFDGGTQDAIAVIAAYENTNKHEYLDI